MNTVRSSASVLTAAALIAALAACGSSSSGKTPAQWGVSSESATTPAQRAADQGQPFTISGAGAKLSVVVDGVDCHIDSSVLTEYYDSMGEKPHVPPPSTGNRWCVLKVHVRNDSKAPLHGAWFAHDSLVNGSNHSTYASDATGKGFDIEQAYEEQSGGIGPEYGLNPGASGPDYAAYQLPKNVRPAAVTVPDDDRGSVIVTLH